MFIELEKTKEELAKEQVIAFSNTSNHVLNNYKVNFNMLYDMIWKSNIHPQDFFDVLGSKAVGVFQAAQKVVKHIMEIDPTYTPPAPVYEYTINVDGTVTVGDKIEVENNE